MNRSKLADFPLRTMLVLGCSVAYLATFGPTAKASDTKADTNKDAAAYTIKTEGSTTTHREDLDGAIGNVYIYTGGSFPVGTHVIDLQFLFDQGTTSAYLTPLLFEQTAVGIYTIRAIGKGAVVFPDGLPQTIAFTTLEGPQLTTNKYYTFGFVNAIVDAFGLPLLTSKGAVDYDPFADGGFGLGGLGTTNDWEATDLNGVDVSIGKTFGGDGADYPFYPGLRTYSAHVSGVVLIP